MNTDFDVIVVGAGPSGTAAAYRLKQAGRRVLLLDRQKFPRVKPCGGGLTIKTLALMPWSVAPVIERAVKTVRLGVTSGGSERSELFEADDHVCTFAVREEFDRFNLEKTIEGGVEFEQTALTEVDERPDFVRVGTGGKAMTTRYLIGADGANSTVRRLTKDGPVRRGFALEGLVDYDAIGTEPTTEFLFGRVENGYGWLFPKGDHVNVGIYTWDDTVTLGKDQLRAYARERLGTDRVEQIRGFPLGFGGAKYAPRSDRVILVGDAAGFAEPLLGEGIHNAVKSGQVVADAIGAAEANGASVRNAVAKAFAPIRRDVARCESLKRYFYAHVEGTGYGLLRFPPTKAALLRGFAAGKTVRELTNAFLLSAFFRAAEPPSLSEFLAGRSPPDRDASAALRG